jgi:hypothetical protein
VARTLCASATTPPGHVQLDIYGELMDSVYLYDKYGDPIYHDAWECRQGSQERVCSCLR